MEADIVEWLNGLGGHFFLFDRIMAVLVSDYFTPVAGSTALVALWFLGRDEAERYRNQIATIVGALAVGLANAQIATVNAFYFRTRPYVNLPIDVHFYRPTDSSFPANSAGVAFAIATAVFIRNRRMGIALYVLAALWGFARVYAGVHYPTDILGGAAIGIVAALAAWAIIRVLEFIPRYVLRVFRMLYIA